MNHKIEAYILKIKCLSLLAFVLFLLASGLWLPTFLLPNTLCQEPHKLGTETEDIALTDNLEIAKAQVKKYPDNPEAHFNLAIALSRTSLVEEAIKELRATKLLIRKTGNTEVIDRKIIEYTEIIKDQNDNPSFNNIRYRLAFSYYLKAYFITKENEKKKPKQENRKKSFPLNIFESRKLSLSTQDPFIKENIEKSIFYFKDILRINPNENWAKIYYGFILVEQLGEDELAKTLWTEVLKNDPNNPASYFFLGELFIKEGNLKEGIKQISQALLLRSLGY